MSNKVAKSAESARQTSLKVGGIYALAAGAWILLSDRVLAGLVSDPALLTRLQTLKGWFFVLVSAGLLIWLVEHYLTSLRREDERQRGISSELDRRGKLLENLISNIPTYIYWKDPNGVYLGCNQRFASVAGVGNRENIVGKTDHEIAWRKGDADLTRLSDRKVIEKRAPLLDIEETQIHADGQVATYLTSRVPMLNESGHVMGLIGICTDITLRKRAEDALRKALQETEEAMDKIKGIVGSVSEGLLVTDPQNRVVLMNRAAEEILGIAQNQAVGKPLDQLIREPWLLLRLQPVLARKTSETSIDFRLPGADGKKERFMQARTSVIRDKTGNVTGMITILFDITREHEVDRMKTEFIATSLRDLRDPLASILGFSELLLAREQSEKEERKKFLAYIHGEAQNLARIVEDRLNISLIESGGELALDRVPTDLEDLLHRLVEYFGEKNPKHSFDLRLPDPSLSAWVDPGRMEQVVSNILANAVKYSPEGGLITVGAREEENGCRIVITDQGRGMPPEERRRIFEKFYRGERSSRNTEGLGLGLNIAKHIVEAHGGELSVESEEGKGTTVGIFIPLGVTAEETRVPSERMQS